MSIASRAALRTRIDQALTIPYFRTTPNLSLSSLWNVGTGYPPTGAAPSTAAACDRTTSGALRQVNSPTTLRLGSVQISKLSSQSTILLYDRLSHQGGLVGNVATPQTTNLPTAALTRYTSGVGVWGMVEVYTALGAGNIDVQVSYTNSGGTVGRTSEATLFGPSIQQMALLPLQQGDLGMKSIESLTFASAFSSAGNCGVSLIKPLYWMPQMLLGTAGLDALRGFALNLTGIQPDACLGALVIGSNTNTPYYVNLNFIDD